MKLSISIALDIQPYAMQSLYWFLIPCSHLCERQPSQSHIKDEETKSQENNTNVPREPVAVWLTGSSDCPQNSRQQGEMSVPGLPGVHEEDQSSVNASCTLGPASALFQAPDNEDRATGN